MMANRWTGGWLVAFLAVVAAAGCDNSGGSGGGHSSAGGSLELLNVSYDPTRELWKDLNEAFIPTYAEQSGKTLTIKQSHGGSGSQARAVIDGLEADVVTLALWSDTDAIARKKLIKEGWEDRLPNRSLPYVSTIVFVVRKGNPKGVRDWPDLVKDGLEVITPNPKVSGNGKLSFLAAWGSVILSGGSEEDAKAYVTKLYQHVPVLDQGARQATTTFAQKGLGDVHLTWENEAHLEVKEAGDSLEIVFPSRSILAEPYVAIVDDNVDRRQTRAAAQAYLEFLYTPAGQQIIATHYYRPISESVLSSNADRFPAIELFPITKLVENWDVAQKKFFAEGGVFDTIYAGPSR
jgi:sulfate/thiosulfate transport system substrate-binding protein